jgi:hypothetical protein
MHARVGAWLKGCSGSLEVALHGSSVGGGNVPGLFARPCLSLPKNHKSSKVEEVQRSPPGRRAAGKPSLAIHRSIVRTEHPNVLAIARRPIITPLPVSGARRCRATALRYLCCRDWRHSVRPSRAQGVPPGGTVGGTAKRPVNSKLLCTCSSRSSRSPTGQQSFV